MLTNPNGYVGKLRLVLFSTNGSELGSEEFDYGAINQLSYSIASLVGPGRSGYYKLHYPADVNILPAQTLVSEGDDAIVSGLLQEELIDFYATRRHALIPPSAHGQINLVTLVNVGRQVESGTVRVSGRDGRWAVWRLAPGHSRTVTLPSASTAENPVMLTITSAASQPQIVFSGFTRSQRRSAVALNFHSDKGKHKGEISGFYFGSDSALLLANLSDRLAPLTITAIDESGNAHDADTELAPSRASTVRFLELLGLASGGSGVVSVSFDADLTVFGDVVNVDRDMTLTAMKDIVKQTFPAYSFPLHIGPGLETVVRIYNPNSKEVDVWVFFAFGDHRYSHSLKKMGPRQFAEIDVKALRDDRTPDEFGNPLPEDAADGQAILVFRGESEIKLVANAFVRDERSGETAVFGCYSCPPALVGIDVIPGTLEGYLGEQEEIEVRAFFDYGLPKFVTESAMYVSAFPTVASVPYVSNNPKVTFNNPGYTYIQASFTDCDEYEEKRSLPVAGGQWSTRAAWEACASTGPFI